MIPHHVPLVVWGTGVSCPLLRNDDPLLISHYLEDESPSPSFVRTRDLRDSYDNLQWVVVFSSCFERVCPLGDFCVSSQTYGTFSSRLGYSFVIGTLGSCVRDSHSDLDSLSLEVWWGWVVARFFVIVGCHKVVAPFPFSYLPLRGMPCL